MSFQTELLLMAGIRKEKLQEVHAELADPLKYKSEGLGMFLSLLAVTCVNTFHFKASGHPFDSEYCEDDEDLVQALKAPWCDPDDIAAWMARYANRRSRIQFHSLEADGLEFGYEFDGKGHYRCLELRPLTKRWKSPPAPPEHRRRKPTPTKRRS